MNYRMTHEAEACDPAVIALLLIPAVLVPGEAQAAQVGCFVTAVLLSIMFAVGIGITLIMKHLLAKYVAKVPKTPWLRMFGITWLELLLVVVVFVAIGTNIWYALLIYLPFSSFLNMKLLARFSGPADGPVAPFPRRFGPFLLLALALPLSLFLSGKIWSIVTNLITFTDLRV
ncbi:MAG: hypothetical protein ACYC7L_00520 [Nitrospirota bacterium]